MITVLHVTRLSVDVKFIITVVSQQFVIITTDLTN